MNLPIRLFSIWRWLFTLNLIVTIWLITYLLYIRISLIALFHFCGIFFWVRLSLNIISRPWSGLPSSNSITSIQLRHLPGIYHFRNRLLDFHRDFLWSLIHDLGSRMRKMLDSLWSGSIIFIISFVSVVIFLFWFSFWVL